MKVRNRNRMIRNKTTAYLLSGLLLLLSFCAPPVIQSFVAAREKFSYIMATADFLKEQAIGAQKAVTYNDTAFAGDLAVTALTATARQAKWLGETAIIEEDVVVTAASVDDNQYLYDFIGLENELYEEENLSEAYREAYSWNIPFVRGTENDVNTLGSADIKVGILDSGVTLSEELPNVTRVDLVPDDTEDPLGVYYDVTGHGTGVTGVIGAAKNDMGLIGIAPNVSLYSIRVLDENNEAPISRIIAGIDWAIENDLDVLNMSFGTETESVLFYQAIRRAYEHGIVLVASAGNTGETTNAVTYPARYDEVIAVGSCDETGARSAFSPNSADVDLLAPGEYIDAISLFDGYSTASGSSLAAPHVTAAAAILLSAAPEKSNEFVKQLLVSAANVSAGVTGVLDIKNALELLPGFAEVEHIPATAISENTEELQEQDVTGVVIGSWSRKKHTELIYDFTDESSNSIAQDTGSVGELGAYCEMDGELDVNNIMLFARAAYVADSLYGVGLTNSSGDTLHRFSPLHAVGYTSGVTSDSRSTNSGGSMNSNYVADTKYLYRLARHFMDSTSVAAAVSSINDVTKSNANYAILQKIVCANSTIYTKSNGTAVKGLVYTSIIKELPEGEPAHAAWKILGLAAHLAGDTYAHRTRVPISSTTKEGKPFYSTTAPDCFKGDNHIVEGVSKTPDATKLDTLLKEQTTYQTQYVTNGTLCQCYDCLRSAVARGKVEFRDISDKYVYENKPSYAAYNGDSSAVYPQRYNIATKHAVKKLITQFTGRKDFTIFVFLPAESTGYTLRLNGLKDYVIGTNTNWDNLQQTTRDRVEALSTGAII